MGTLLVTGGGGFLAQHIAAEFKAAGWRVSGLGRTAPSTEGIYADFWQVTLPSSDLGSYLLKTCPDLIINTVGTSSISFSLEHPTEDLIRNVVDYYQILEQLRRSQIPARVIQLSSAAVYGQPEHFPISEDTPLRPVSPYGFHKLQAELVSREFHVLHGLPVCNLRIFSAYGKGLKRQIIWDLCRQASATGKLVLEGTGSEERDFIHAKDVARAALLVFEKGEFNAGSYNIATGTSRPVRDIAHGIAKLGQLARPPEFAGKMRAGNPQIWRVTPDRLEILGFKPHVSWEDGFTETVLWCLSNLKP